MNFPKDKGVIHGTSKNIAVDFFTSHIAPTQTPCTFRAQIVVSKATAFYAAILHDGSDEKKVKFNGAQDLVADTVYIFDLLVHQGDTVNYEVDDDSTTVYCRVQEIPFGSASTVDPV